MLILNSLCDSLGRVARAWTLALAAALFLVVIFTVALRGTIGWVPSWSEEVPRYLLIWIGFMAAACGVDIKEHIAFDILLAGSGPAAARALSSLINCGIIAFGGIMLVFGIDFVRDFGDDMMESIPFTNIWYYASVPIAGALIILFALRDLLNVWFAPALRTRRIDLDIGPD